MPRQQLSVSGSNHSRLHGTSLFDHDRLSGISVVATYFPLVQPSGGTSQYAVFRPSTGTMGPIPPDHSPMNNSALSSSCLKPRVWPLCAFCVVSRWWSVDCRLFGDIFSIPCGLCCTSKFGCSRVRRPIVLSRKFSYHLINYSVQYRTHRGFHNLV